MRLLVEFTRALVVDLKDERERQREREMIREAAK
jgi:hypothetical protein